MRGERVVVAMSGGVDSSVVAALALEAGYEVEGVTLELRAGGDDGSAAAVCRQLGIEHHLLDRESEFRDRVIVPSARELAAGRTPNPCALCNPEFKFAELLNFASARGAKRLLTGHYARIDAENRLRRGVDAAKDQSYFLYRLSREQLGRSGFPLGALTKEEVRRLASGFGLTSAERPDSQDLCFGVPGECGGETLRRLAGLPSRAGRFVYCGREVGRHEGIHRYTLGQRQGLGVALGVPGYISSIDAASGDITLVTDASELLSTGLVLSQCVFAAPLPDHGRAAVRIRYRSPAVECEYSLLPDGRVEVRLERPQRAVTPGQSGVLYSGDLVLGGGIIEETT